MGMAGPKNHATHPNGAGQVTVMVQKWAGQAQTPKRSRADPSPKKGQGRSNGLSHTSKDKCFVFFFQFGIAGHAHEIFTISSGLLINFLAFFKLFFLH